jgi:hypothetical protein
MSAFETVLGKDMKDGKLIDLRTRFGLEYTPSF